MLDTLRVAWAVLCHAVSMPWNWTCAAILAVVPMTLQLGSSWTSPLVDVDPWRSSYALAFVGSLLGTVAVSSTLWHCEWLLGKLSRTESLLSESIAMLGASLLLGLPGPLVVIVVLGTPPRTGAAALGLVLLAVQRSALALLVRRMPLSPGLQVFVLVAVGWWIPATMPPSLAPAIERWLHLPLQLVEAGPDSATPRAWLTDMAPLVALVLAAWLGRSRTPRRQ